MNKYLRIGLVLLVCAYFWYYVKTYTDGHFIDAVNLIFHEAGHTIIFFLGDLVQASAGSLFQIALPLCIAIYFFRTNQKMAGALCLLWVGQNMLNVSIYAGDALAMNLELLGGENVMHDWNYILSSLDVLRYAPNIAHFLYQIGFITIATGTILSLYYSLKEEDFRKSTQTT